MYAPKRTPRTFGCSIWGQRYYSPDQGRWVHGEHYSSIPSMTLSYLFAGNSPSAVKGGGHAWPLPGEPGWIDPRRCGPDGEAVCTERCFKSYRGCDKYPTAAMASCCKRHEDVHWRQTKPTFCKRVFVMCGYWCRDANKTIDESALDPQYVPVWPNAECPAWALGVGCYARLVNSGNRIEAYCARKKVNQGCAYWNNSSWCRGSNVPMPNVCYLAPLPPPSLH
jgi:hypothetical protein